MNERGMGILISSLLNSYKIYSTLYFKKGYYKINTNITES